ncbi:NAD kinase [Actinopolymorpha pittospori]|uniref:NAD kinase n=1 Tax=Actinopolymorpha pittospori TaxID=648752 RepID=A0A927RLV7_9ACTN|nr:NAD+ kinase [Actinopolymorpha pittospori]
MTDERTVLLVVHTGRSEATHLARESAAKLAHAGVGVRLLAPDAEDVGVDKAEVVEVTPTAAEGCEMVMVLGGDGTILRGAEVARASGTPVLGVNLGHIGFLAESERDDLDVTIDHVVHRKYAVEERMTLDVTITYNGGVVASQWALNEASIEKSARERMLEMVVEVDGRPLSRWGADGIVAATPTGSTAYAFSAGGPIVWPELEAMLVVPLSAHALFSRPLVVSPRSVVAVELMHRNTEPGVLWCDGRRTEELPPGARVEVRRGVQPVRLARLHRGLFTDRLVAKFGLPVQGWRGGLDQPPRHAAADVGAVRRKRPTPPVDEHSDDVGATP